MKSRQETNDSVRLTRLVRRSVRQSVCDYRHCGQESLNRMSPIVFLSITVDLLPSQACRTHPVIYCYGSTIGRCKDCDE